MHTEGANAVYIMASRELFDGIVEAIQREKSLKKYRRDWKINLIQEANPHWEDLYESLFAVPRGPLTP